jgi:hypothetical protein
VTADKKESTDKEESTDYVNRTEESTGANKLNDVKTENRFTPPEKFSMSFSEYRTLKKSMKMRSKIAGIPMGFFGIGLSSAVNVHLNPHMFEMTPEEVEPIL